MTGPGANTHETPLWRFSLYFYRLPGVADACIELQDRCGVDVNLLLFVLWLAANGRRLTAAQVKELDDMVRDWRNLTIIPLRSLRRTLKVNAPLVTPGRAEAFRTKIKGIELEAERLQQEALYDHAQATVLGAQAAPADAARSNLVGYQSVLALYFPKAPTDHILGTFDRLDHAAFAPGATQKRKSRREKVAGG
jgi:uncharacterized protein (TIGR02444 family)